MKKSGYSEIIGAEEYNRIMTQEHVFIREADDVIMRIIDDFSWQKKDRVKELVELGCGPGRITNRLNRILHSLKVTAIDIDQKWLNYAQSMIRCVEFIKADAQTFFHKRGVDIFVSQGFHHHIEKGNPTRRYLANIYKQLNVHGIYIVSDEILPYYDSEEERKIKLCLWYSYVISNAHWSHFTDLFNAEVETFLDDYFSESKQLAVKTKEQLDVVRNSVLYIEQLSSENRFVESRVQCRRLMEQIEEIQEREKGKVSPPFSRGDHKICFEQFFKEISSVGFKIRDVKTIGPTERIGGFGIYTLQK